MIWDKTIDEKAYRRLKKVVADVIFDDKKNFNKQAQKFANKLEKLTWGQMQILVNALDIVFTKFKGIEEEK